MKGGVICSKRQGQSHSDQTCLWPVTRGSVEADSMLVCVMLFMPGLVAEAMQEGFIFLHKLVAYLFKK